MREVIAEFLTTDPQAPDSYGDSGCRLEALGGVPYVLRHEHYDDELQHKIYLFARHPESGAQVFIHLFPMPAGHAEYQKELQFYVEQQQDFRLPAGRKFDASLLAPAKCEGFGGHVAFRTRDGKYRRRIVHAFTGTNRNVLLIFSLDSADFLKSRFCRRVAQHLALSDTALQLIAGGQ